MNEWTPIVAAVAMLFGGGGVVAFFKVKPESDQMVVVAAQGAVAAMKEVVGPLRDQVADQELRLSDQAGEIKWLKEELQKCNDHKAEAKRAEAQVKKTAQELANRVKALEELAGGS